jgi:hypothetical protein
MFAVIDAGRSSLPHDVILHVGRVSQGYLQIAIEAYRRG